MGIGKERKGNGEKCENVKRKVRRDDIGYIEFRARVLSIKERGYNIYIYLYVYGLIRNSRIEYIGWKLQVRKVRVRKGR